MIKLSTKGRYGTRAIMDLALHFKDKPILLKDIAKREEISIRYLEQIIIPLKIAGLVKSVRGAKGGYKLARPPSEIKLGEVIQALEGSWSFVECVDDPSYCSRISICPTYEIWRNAKKVLDQVFQNTTVQDLVNIAQKKRKIKAR
ncbi:MAG: RrF2 family transcriptional regulator [Candidatus Aminicenantia bacterium]